MAKKLVWSPEAIGDIEDITSFIQKDSEFYAKAVISKILDLTENLLTYPFIGRVVPEFRDEKIREKFAYNYRIIYEISDNFITVLAILHGSRLIDKLNFEQ